MRICKARLLRRHGSEGRRGTAAVEFAFVLPVFITLVLGIIEMGRGIMVGQLVTNAARDAARTACLTGTTNSQVVSAAQSTVATTCGVSQGDVLVSIATSSGSVSTAKTGDLITVTVSLPFEKVSYLPPKYLSGKSLTATSAMRHE